VTPIGRRIERVRDMTEDEAAELDWGRRDRPSAVLVLDDGTLLFPSRDDEGNGGGSLFEVSPAGGHFVVAAGEAP
jgi:hypothetical protein